MAELYGATLAEVEPAAAARIAASFMATPNSSPASSTPHPVFGCILFGGSLSGALVRDVRLANELVKRGFEVHVWWAMDWQKSAGLDPAIKQHWLFNGMRMWNRGFTRGPLDSFGRLMNRLYSDRTRAHGLQRRPKILARLMNNLTRLICDGVERDEPVIRRFASELEQHRVTHLLPMLEMLGLWAEAARKRMKTPARNLITFQGYELYSTYARELDVEREFYRRLAEAVERSDFPAIAVSEDYRHRVHEELAIPLDRMVAIPPGVPSAKPMDRAQARELLTEKFHGYRDDLPLVAYLGRRDTEKGLDLLLYAATILRQRGRQFQLAICGPSLWGDHYGKVCQKIAEELRCPVLWRRFVPDDVRTALFSTARCVVYPSIHREPFGMVAAEVVAHGTPAIVPDHGGVACAIEANGETAGVRFKTWDSGDLADQIERLLTDDQLHSRLCEAGPRVAAYFSISNLADRVLNHLGLPLRC